MHTTHPTSPQPGANTQHANRARIATISLEPDHPGRSIADRPATAAVTTTCGHTMVELAIPCEGQDLAVLTPDEARRLAAALLAAAKHAEPAPPAVRRAELAEAVIAERVAEAAARNRQQEAADAWHNYLRNIIDPTARQASLNADAAQAAALAGLGAAARRTNRALAALDSTPAGDPACQATPSEPR